MRGTRTLTAPNSRPELFCSAGLLLWALLWALAQPLAADEPTPTPGASGPQPKIPAPLRVLKDFDPVLARKSHFGIYLRTQRVGMFTTLLEKAPAESGAAYREVTTLDLSVGGTHYGQTVTILMRANLSLVRKESLESTRASEGAEPQHRRTILEEKGGQWVRTQIQGKDESATRSAQRTPSQGPNYGPCLTAVAARLASSTQDGAPATYELPAILWAGRTRKTTGPATLKLQISPPQEVEHRGQRAQAVRAEITGKGAPLELWLTPKGQLMTLSGGGIPYRFVQGTPEQVKADLPQPKPAAAPGAKTPRAAIEVFLLALARVKPADALDAVVDFEAVLAGFRKADPQAPKISADELATLFKTRIERGEGPMTQTLAKAQLKKLQVKIKGETATAKIPQHKEPFQLRRTKAGTWLIVAWPAN
jgi:hypothetical protein